MTEPGDLRCMEPFTSSVENVFRTMLKLPVTAGTPKDGAHTEGEKHVRATVKLTGQVLGAVTLIFPEKTAEAAIKAFIGRVPTFGGADYRDAVGELANMVAGGAAVRIPGRRVAISCPSVAVSPTPAAKAQPNAVCMTIPFTIAAGTFAVEVVLSNAEGAAKAA